MSNVKINRKNFLISAATLGGGSVVSPYITPRLEGAEVPDLDGRKPFVLYVHLGSCCGVSSGFAQPLKAGEWQKGFFTRGKKMLANNPLLNEHHEYGSLVFNKYNEMLGDISKDMCLGYGTPNTLDHATARMMQRQGSTVVNASPEWAMGVSQNCKTQNNPSPMVNSPGGKTSSVGDITLVQAQSIEKFREITADIPEIPKAHYNSIWNAYKNRFKIESLGSTNMPGNIFESMNSQLDTLINGLPALNQAKTSIQSIDEAMDNKVFDSMIDYNPDKKDIKINQAFRDQLKLAGILAKTGIGSGMTITLSGYDDHNGGAEVSTARDISAKWALITMFWKWCQANKLSEDVMIVCSHDFGRSPYNTFQTSETVITAKGQQKIVSPGRDHGLYFGMTFINANVPSEGRIGNLLDNFTPVAGTDTQGNYDAEQGAHFSADLVGSMLMRVYPKLFKTERMIRKHWPNFKELNFVSGKS